MSIERIILTDDTGRWFLRDSATEFGQVLACLADLEV